MLEAKYPVAGSGVVFKENFESVQWTTRNSGTITDGSFSNGVLSCNGTTTKVDVTGSKRGIQAVRLRITLNSTTEDVITLSASHSITISGGAISATGFSSPTIYVDGIPTSSIATGEHEILITTATAFEADTVIYGYVTSYFDGEMDLLEFFNENISPARAFNLANNRQYAGLVTNGLVGYWDFTKQTPYDWSHNDFNGVLTPGNGGFKKQGLSCDGSTTKVDLGDIQLTGSMTLFGVLDLYTQTTDDAIISKLGGGGSRSYDLRVLNNKITLDISSDGNDVITHQGETIINNGVNYFYMGVYDANNQTMDVYLNGISDASQRTSGVPSEQFSANGITVKIGSNGSSSTYINGLHKIAGIYNRALSSFEIAQDHQYFRTAGWLNG